MQKKLILQVISSPVCGGAEVLVRELGQRIKLDGFDSEVVYFNKFSHLNIKLHSNESSLLTGDRNPLTIFRLRKFIKARLKTYQKIIIHVHLTYPLFYTPIAVLFLKNVTLLFTEHNTSNKRRSIPCFKYIEHFFYSRYKKICCISKGVELSLEKWLSKKLHSRLVVVNNGAKLYTPKERCGFAKPKIISIGTLTKKKNFKTSIKAISFIKDEIESYTIVGEGAERGVLEKLIKENGLEKKVYLPGRSDQIERRLHEADIQLIPSLWEGFGLVAVEGMSTGIFIIASEVDGLKEVLGQDNPAVKLVKEIETPEKWAFEIKQSIDFVRNNIKWIAAAAQKQSEKYSIENMIKEYTELYRSI
ncbi:MAG: glycosyltransferase family 4 protein [Spirochaetes bacterium]|nr:glycosyltransferase family 4 protein [Spirochaetota bacterium]